MEGFVLDVIGKLYFYSKVTIGDPILLGIALFFTVWIYLSVVWVRYLCSEPGEAEPDVASFSDTGTPIWSDVDLENGGMDVNPESVLMSDRYNERLGFSGVGVDSSADSGVVQIVSSWWHDLGEIDLEGSGISPLELGIGDLECYLERHAHRTGNDLGVWLPHLESGLCGQKYVSMFEPAGTLPGSLSKTERIYRMWIVTEIDHEANRLFSSRTKVYVPYVPFRLGNISMDGRVYEAVQSNKLNVGDYLNRHTQGDWGSIRTVDAVRNEFSAVMGRGEITSLYRLDEETLGKYKLHIVTSEDHSSTRIGLLDASLH